VVAEPEAVKCAEVTVASKPRDMTAVDLVKGKDASDITEQYPGGHKVNTEEMVIVVTLKDGPKMISEVSLVTRNAKNVRIQLDADIDESNPDVSIISSLINIGYAFPINILTGFPQHQQPESGNTSDNYHDLRTRGNQCQ
jgi:hypothetical protein